MKRQDKSLGESKEIKLFTEPAASWHHMMKKVKQEKKTKSTILQISSFSDVWWIKKN